MPRFAPHLALSFVLFGGCFEDAGGDDGEDDSTGSELSCEDYCTTIGDLCVDSNRQYDTAFVCEATCAVFTVGSPDDDLGNTLGCRMNYALASGETPVADCPHAGPSGGGICGGVCESFCAIQAAACTGPNQQYQTTADCVRECEQFPGLDTPFTTQVSDANTYVCRLKHLLYAVSQPDDHCGHIVAASSLCVD